MKRILYSLPLLLFTLYTNAQEPTDVLKYSFYRPGGTARVQAIGGSMGSLGGDITATFVNPAGLAFYRTGDFVITPQFQFGKTNSVYLDAKDRANLQRFNFGTTGFVWGTQTGNRKGVKSAALSLAYNRTADFNANFVYTGLNRQSSFSQRFLEEIGNDGIRDRDIVSGAVGINSPNYRSNYAFGTSLAYNTYWIDRADGRTRGNDSFFSRAVPLLSTSGLIQQQSVRTDGGIHEFAFGLAANTNDKLMFGGTLGVPVVVYNRKATYAEADPTLDTTNRFDNAVFEERFKTRGYGINIKLGMIYKPQEFWRIGLAFHSPTFYQMTDSYDYIVTTNTERYKETLDMATSELIGTNSEFKYNLITPYRIIGSISYVLREIQDVTKQRGFITADVEYVNHAASSFSTSDDGDNSIGTENYLKSVNRSIDNAYKGTFNFRAGGELKFTTFMVRLGAAYYGNPYKEIKDEFGDRLNLSGGLGYRNKGFFVDLTYVHARNRDVHYAYRLQNGAYAGARLNNINGHVVATLGLKF